MVSMGYIVQEQQSLSFEDSHRQSLFMCAEWNQSWAACELLEYVLLALMAYKHI